MLLAVTAPGGWRLPAILAASATGWWLAGGGRVRRPGRGGDLAAVVDWMEDLDESDLPALGLTCGRPAGTALWRLLVRLDSVALGRVLAAWLLACATPRHRAPLRRPRPRWEIIVSEWVVRCW